MILHSVNDISYIPQRIVSLVPSQTELLASLGLDNSVAAITKFCIHPTEWRTKKVFAGGTKNIHPGRIRTIQPDLIIANKEENVREQIEDLANDFPVWLTEVNNLEDALQMIDDIGRLTNTKARAGELINHIQTGFSQLKPGLPALKTAYLIWKDPYMTVGGDTFIHDMLDRCGCGNIFAGKTRYPQTSIEELQNTGCELLMLSSEPYPFTQKHIDELQEQLPNSKIILADGEMFSWYGSRLLLATAYFKQLLSQINSSN